jgi:hypothetical protein
MHSERVVIARVVVVVAIATAIGITAAVRTFGSLLLEYLFPIVEVIVLPSDGRPRAWAMTIGVVTLPLIFWLGRNLLVILPLHASDALRPTDGSRDPLLLDVVARCSCPSRDMPSAMDESGPLDLHGWLELASLRLLRL